MQAAVGNVQAGLDDLKNQLGGFQVQLPGQPADGLTFDVFAALDEKGLDVDTMANAGNLIGDIKVQAGQATFTGPGPITLPTLFLAPYFKVASDFTDTRVLNWKGGGTTPTGPVTLAFACERVSPNWSHENPDFEVTVPGGAKNTVALNWARVELPARYTVTAKWGLNSQVAGQLRVYTRHNRDEDDVAFDLPSSNKNWDLNSL